MTKLTDTAEAVLGKRYYLKNNADVITEDWKKLCKRVSTHVSKPDANKNGTISSAFFNIMYNLDFLPNSPCLMNAGIPLGQLAACFVLPIEDNIDSIYKYYSDAAKISKSGGGCGASFSNIRPENSAVKTTSGVASGPLSFASVQDRSTEIIKQGGRRRGANMGVLRIDHPDILKFINAKENDGDFSNFNFSVAITHDFMTALKNNQNYNLIDPTNNQIVGELNTKEVFDIIVNNTWKGGDPGVLFIDTANDANQLPHLGRLESTNPSLRKGTKVWTNKGIKKIEELAQTNFKVRNLFGQESNAKCWKSGENKKLYSIYLKGGHKHFSTPEHKWPILLKNGTIIKKSSSELNIGDWIFKGGFENIISTNQNYNREDGFLVGWNIGDGWKTRRKDGRNQYGFIVSNEDKKHNIHNILEKRLIHYGCKTNFDDKNEVNLSSKKLREFFDELKYTGKKYGLPLKIWDGVSDDFLKGLIDGLFSSDGSVDPVNNSIILTTSKRKLAKDICELLSFYGLKVNCKKSEQKNASFPNGKKYNKKYVRYDLSITNYVDIVHFHNIFNITNKDKQSKIKRCIKNLSNLNKILYSDFVRITDIKYGEVKSDVWDINVEDKTHCFKIPHVVTGNCGEQWLFPNESCNLGSINLSNFVKNGVIDYKRLGAVVRTATRFLDNVIDMNVYPIPEIEEMTLKTRKIGLGVMGLHDLLIQLEVPYDSDEAREIAADIMKFIELEAKKESEYLAKDKGFFPEYDEVHCDFEERRNASLTSIQPTGSVSMIADCSSGCEPYYSIIVEKHVMDGEKLILVNKHFEIIAKREGFYSETLINEIVKNGTVVGNKRVPEKWQNIFKGAMDISVEGHIKMQAILQNNGVHSSISKTINMPFNATKEDIGKAYLMGYNLGCKGLTVYRDGSKSGQVLNTGESKKVKDKFEKTILPDELAAKRYKLKSKDGDSIYIIVCFDDNETPVEIFAKFAYDNRIESQEKAMMWTTVCRLVSLALRCGTPISEIIKQFDRSSGSMFDLPAQLGKLLKTFMSKTQHGYKIKCKECGGEVVFIEGCEKCLSCGLSKCN